MIEFRMPSMGADMDEGMLVNWWVGPGDEVRRGQVIAEIESEKGIIEAECWEEGVIEELLVQPGPDVLAVGTPLAVLRPLAGAEAVGVGEPTERRREALRSEETRTAVATMASRPPPPVRHLAKELGVDLSELEGPVTRSSIVRAAAHPGRTRPHASPRARARADEMGIDLTTVTAARPDGLITMRDLTDDAIEALRPPIVEPTTPSTADERQEAMRRAVARSMSRSKREIPHYYLGTHIDMATALEWLDHRNADRGIAERVLPAVLLLRATTLALREVPELNGHYLDGMFVPSERVHLGVAISLRGGGLVAPAIHDAHLLGIDELMAALSDLVTRARTWRVRSSEMSDPTVTVTNLGDRGVETTFPVIIPPQVAIVGFGKVAEQPIAYEGMLAVHPVVHATLAADHRVTDGHRGGLFLEALTRLLQHPEDL